MRILVLRSKPGEEPEDRYSVRMDVQYADRVLGHLLDRGDYCSACGSACVKCRGRYDFVYQDDLAGVITFPAVLPVLLEDPERYLPEAVPDHTVLVALAVHDEILTAFIRTFPAARGIIVPQEGPDWISPYAREQLGVFCRDNGIQIAFPKPFCSFNPGSGVLSDFKVYFKIGKPDIRLTIHDNKIKEARVLCSAPCGATYFTARGLEGKRVNEDLAHFIDQRLSAFPCTASRAVDREFKDSVTHQAVQIQRGILKSIS